MDKEKLNEAAKHEAYNGYSGSYKDRKEGFIKGAEWLMTQPLADRLTKEEEERVKAKYKELKSLNSITNDMFADDTAILEWLFGKELFNEK